MQPEARERLEHVVKAAETVLQFIAGKSFDDYSADELRRSVVERQFTIVGEALREAARVDPAIETQITGFRRIVDFRNVLVHGYTKVYDEGIWAIIEDHLPRLLAEVRVLLKT